MRAAGHLPPGSLLVTERENRPTTGRRCGEIGGERSHETGVARTNSNSGWLTALACRRDPRAPVLHGKATAARWAKQATRFQPEVIELTTRCQHSSASTPVLGDMTPFELIRWISSRDPATSDERSKRDSRSERSLSWHPIYTTG